MNPRVEWMQKSGQECLKFTFKGKFSEQMALMAISKWKEAFISKPGKKIVIVWDCLEMDGYETEARNKWQNALKSLKDQIDTVWLVTNSGFIKIGATLMSNFTSFKLKIVSSISEITLQ
ncbi:MAG: hypothetical protein HZA16_15455 [Nitrospirae bacterium]|nr:hypothetical protein [Nitrospirota bacterium]